MSKRVLVCGAGGFIGSHLVKRLKADGYWVRGVDLKYPEFATTQADEFIQGDLRDINVCQDALNHNITEVYQLAADMGGAGYLFTGDNDANVMHNSSLINLNILETCKNNSINQLFYSSSACVYPEYNQLDADNPNCTENTVYPAQPDSEYGWEKLFSEHLYLAYARNYRMKVSIARFHNVFGPEGTYQNGKEKVPAALCRKIASAQNNEIEMWGDGQQTRSFLYIDECIEGIVRLMQSDFTGPVNLGSSRLISINQLAQLIMDIAGKQQTIKHIDGPIGVRGRCSDNQLIAEKLGWQPQENLEHGLTKTYQWIAAEIAKDNGQQ